MIMMALVWNIFIFDYKSNINSGIFKLTLFLFEFFLLQPFKDKNLALNMKQLTQFANISQQKFFFYKNQHILFYFPLLHPMNQVSTQQLKISLQSTLSLIPLYQDLYLYNILVDPYLFASFGIIPSNKHPSDMAVCKNPQCDLTIQFDTEQEGVLREDIQLAVQDHDQQCQFSKINKNIINFNLFSRLGNWIYQERLASLQEKGIWIQLNPKQILQVVDIEANRQQLNNVQTNLTLEQFMQLDSQITKKCLSKVTSSVFLAIFGWQWSETGILNCDFCGVSRDVRDFVSPSQYSLMRVQEGFCFLRNHQPWCCLIEPSKIFWRQILRQASCKRLQNILGTFGRSWGQIQKKNMQRNMIQIFSGYLPKLNDLERNLTAKRHSLNQKYKHTRIDFVQSVNNQTDKLANLMKEQTQTAQKMIKAIVQQYPSIQNTNV